MSENIINVATNDMPISQRVQLGKRIEAELRARREAAAALKSTWLADARRDFSPGARQSCSVCGCYSGLAQAHHVAPLASQFDLGIRIAVHESVWLCPTHHALVHVFLSSSERFLDAFIVEGVALQELDACEALAKRGADLLVKSALAEWRA